MNAAAITAIAQDLERFRKRLERDAGRINLHELSMDATFFLYDLCQYYGMDDQQTRAVLGSETWRTLQNYLDLVPAKTRKP
jgi:hypothetical protein